MAEDVITHLWNLVCEREALRSLMQTSYMVGFLVGSIVFGTISDRFGRRTTALLSILISIIAGISAALSPYYWLFLLMRFIVALGVAGLANSGFVLVIEVCGPTKRSTVAVIKELGFAVGLMVLAGLAYLWRDWFPLQLTISIFPLITFVLYYWFLPESPRWLLTRNRIADAEKILHKAALLNNTSAPNVSSDRREILNNHKRAGPANLIVHTVVDLLRTPNLRKISLNMFFCWFINAFVYYGLSLGVVDLDGNPYLNVFISGLMEIPAYVLTIFVLHQWGRQYPLCFFMVIGGISCSIMPAVPQDMDVVKVVLAMFGKFCITSSFEIVYIYGAELYPTTIRNMGIGCSCMCARVGSAVAPLVRYLGVVLDPNVPPAVYGSLAVTSGLLVLLLPETKNRSLPETLEDGENFGRKERSSSENPQKKIKAPTQRNKDTSVED
ncbi:organic cation transporter protein-like isoform X2 [Limulus polyphemus]|uniref:Organic cation transporter protein-like isoform X2 n=1 Tax=Limulus polyphemus TaxID=6850 RepID=A0ABM1SSC4_LIMPO|nr:organic cation transporter protein-like isoform X2 [Limulus polyphemus]XP_022246531.1 organic cation transporter protein-like isoform X2 [Limulus polyphemus]